MDNFSDILNNWLAYAISVGSWRTLGNMLSLAIAVFVAIMLLRAVSAKGFNMADLFMERGKIGGSKMRINITFMVMMWVLIYQTLSERLTEWLVAAILLAFVADRAYHRKDTTKTPDDQP